MIFSALVQTALMPQALLSSATDGEEHLAIWGLPICTHHSGWHVVLPHVHARMRAAMTSDEGGSSVEGNGLREVGRSRVLMSLSNDDPQSVDSESRDELDERVPSVR